MFHIFKTSEEIQKWIVYRSNYKSQEELIKSYDPLESDFNPDEAYAEVNNFKNYDQLDNFTTQYDGILGALQIAYFETHLNVDPLDHITAYPDLVTLDNMPPIYISIVTNNTADRINGIQERSSIPVNYCPMCGNTLN